MKAVVLCFAMVVAVTLARPGEDSYPTKYDNVDLDEILSNPRLFIPYINCILDKGKCAPDAKELKDHIPDALENKCAKCNEVQKKGTEKVIKHLINNEEEFWKELKEKFDPEDKYTTIYEKELKDIKA